MSHLESSTLAQYNSLADPHLQCYFSNERIRSHLKHAGLISSRGEIISDGEYRTRLARLEHRKHVRHMLAENIVNRAIDMERARQAEMKRQFQMVAKAALVNNVKESRRRNETSSGLMSNSNDMALLSIDSFCPHTRSKSLNQQNEISDKQTRIPRVRSAHTDDDHRAKSSSKTRKYRRSLRRSKKRSSSSLNTRPSSKYPADSSSRPCRITMVYYGPKLKVDYDHLVFEPVDEIMVMQQHCGGENVVVYKENLKPGAEFSFDSRRHSDYPFGLSFYVKGFIDSRISTCCEYKHRRGVRLGGDRGHFAIKSVKGSKPCIKCRFEKQARFKRYARSSKNKEDKKPIIISLPASDQSKMKQTPTKIPVKRTSISNENYGEDFEDSEKEKYEVRDGYSTDSSINKKRKYKSNNSTPKVPKRVSPIIQKKLSSTSDKIPKEQIRTKTWQIIFYTSNIPKEKDLLVKFSFLANDEKHETETYEINMKQFHEISKVQKQYSFSVKLLNIGKPEQIRLKIETTENDEEEEEEDIKWHLDHIELIDPETQSHSIFPCKQWIRPFQEKILRLSQETPQNERTRKSSSSRSSSRSSSSNHKTRQQSSKIQPKAKTSARSSNSSTVSKQSQTKWNSPRRISPDNQSQKSTSQNDNNDQENKIRYRVTIYPSNDVDGEFNPNRNSRIFLRLNNQTKETILARRTDQLCPTFEPGEKQTFELDFVQNINEKPKKLTIGYINSDITATKWKLEKIVLVNIETGDEIIFPCKEILCRDESNFRAEKTFKIQSNDEFKLVTPTNQKINHEEQIQISEKQRKNANNIQKSFSLHEEEEQIETPKNQQTNGYNTKKSPSPQKLNDHEEEQIETPKKHETNGYNQQKSPSLQKLNDEEEQIETPKKQETNGYNQQKSPSLQKLNDEEEQIETSKKQETNGYNKQKSPSLQKLNDEEGQIETPQNQQTDGYTKQKSPSFQSMNDDEADYKKIFRLLDPKNEFELGSPPPSPTPRPKTRRSRQNQDETQPVDPLIGPDGLTDQTARSNDQQKPTTVNAETQFKRWYTTNDHDDDQDN